MNDLLGLKRAWGAYPGDGSGTVDCCLMALEVHRRLGYHNYLPEVAWIFEQYTDDTLPKNFIARWLLQNGKRLAGPEPHALALLPSHGVGAVGLYPVGDHRGDGRDDAFYRTWRQRHPHCCC